ncbi:Tetratricopeptide repeat-containing protein [Andreprevotia lacus DSM 23236]|jgi:tetratricopeptide (TPR) repeat protein|uniref:Tetratricopeptide repeat-containing protein n=1 Tax=Andreprevotia lacus DSM 23236 TaxID=1121001 RepID=A0A1W1XZQ3_9NEIS|nr:tetratricopeptide repeat protein [Andreprevotia lacus]SMC29440.1 Tetratricopeptide repeat-containing protein [Andreprevotia lacus DSM 23236]
MCSIDTWWWLTFAAILLSGFFGGLARYHWERLEGNSNGSWYRYSILGVAAAFLVPLFLNTISSTLLDEVHSHPQKMYVLIGFCLAAGTFAKQFLGSVARKALEFSKEARAMAERAQDSARLAERDAKRADNRAIAMYDVLKHIDADQIDDALRELGEILDTDSENAEAWVWNAYCLKRKGRYDEAIANVQTALRLEGREVVSWLYNMACYQSLAGQTAGEVAQTLARATAACNTRRQLHHLQVDLQNDGDFDSVRRSKEFSAVLATFA